MSMENKKEAVKQPLPVVPSRLELETTEPKSAVLPLHHGTLPNHFKRCSY